MPDDSSLLRALKAGDSGALAELFENYADRIYRLALGSLQNPAEAEDVVQETFLKAISNIDKFEGRSNLGTWLYRVAYNASMDRLRRRPEAQLPSDEPDFSSPDSVPMPEVLVEWDTPEDEIIDEEDRQALDEAIQQLPDTLRIVFILRDIEDLSTSETAEILELSEGAVKVRLHRARLELRERLAIYFAERQAA